MQRYNRGFFKFGPLEQAEDGELVFYKDALEVIEAYKADIYFLNSEASKKSDTIKWRGSRVEFYRTEVIRLADLNFKTYSTLSTFYTKRLVYLLLLIPITNYIIYSIR